MASPDDTKSIKTVIDHAPLEFPPAIDPIFWGTSDLLVWDTGDLLKSINKEHLFRKIWALDTLSDGEYHRMAAEVFEPMFIELSNLIGAEELIVPRGFYGFFPVISDKMSVVVLDPSDFHSELFTIPCPQSKLLGGRSLADFYRPEGDVLAVSALTLGSSIDRYLEQLESDAATTKKAGFLRGIGTIVLDSIKNKMIMEVRRGLGIDVATGFSLPLQCGVVDAACETALFETLGFEERLGIEVQGCNRYSSTFSTIQLLSHHPQVNDFVHFGT